MIILKTTGCINFLAYHKACWWQKIAPLKSFNFWEIATNHDDRHLMIIVKSNKKCAKNAEYADLRVWYAKYRILFYRTSWTLIEPRHILLLTHSQIAILWRTDKMYQEIKFKCIFKLMIIYITLWRANSWKIAFCRILQHSCFKFLGFLFLYP